MSDKILITAEGKKKFEDELRYLKNEATDQNRKEIAAAREQGDLSENADYDAAKDKETEIAARINKLQYILDKLYKLEKRLLLKIYLMIPLIHI